MAKNKNQALRAQVARAERLVGAKASRILKGTGAAVAGSEFDPRRDSARTRGYNATQLRSYLAQLDAFRNPKVQFVGGAKGAPLPKHLWQRYLNIQTTYGGKVAEELGSVADVKLQSGQTVAEREATFMPEKRSALGRSANRPLGTVELEPGNIASVKALESLEDRLRRRINPNHVDRTLKYQRGTMVEMLERLGESDLIKGAEGMTHKQFNVLWNYTDFADFLSQRYESVKHMNVAEEVRTSDEFRAEIRTTLKWAKGAR